MSFKLIPEEKNVIGSALLTSTLPDYILDCMTGEEPDTTHLETYIDDPNVEVMSHNEVLLGIRKFLSGKDVRSPKVQKSVGKKSLEIIMKIREKNSRKD